MIFGSHIQKIALNSQPMMSSSSLLLIFTLASLNTAFKSSARTAPLCLRSKSAKASDRLFKCAPDLFISSNTISRVSSSESSSFLFLFLG